MKRIEGKTLKNLNLYVSEETIEKLNNSKKILKDITGDVYSFPLLCEYCITNFMTLATQKMLLDYKKQTEEKVKEAARELQELGL